MTPDDFQFIADLLKKQSGLVLNPDKGYLLESRLMPVARERGMKDLDALVAQMRRRDTALIKEVIEAMTTNESFFFRDIKPFDMFRDVTLPALLESRASRKSLRIWCAAASSGQEPYSLAMILKEQAAKLAGWKVDIVGTDISTQMLTKAKAGKYSQFEVQRGLPIQMLVKYFKKEDENWFISPELRKMVQFREFNLLDDLRVLGSFDVVFCRNVLIYFDQPTKTQVLDGLAGVLPEDGSLYLGGAETVLGLTDRFEPLPGHRGLYRLTGVGGKATPTEPAAGGDRPKRTWGAARTAGAKPAFAKRPGSASRPDAGSGIRPTKGPRS
ncbi:Chemotaxis protein methyltransferase [Magnetospira sp. QH-2]|nr:Chemotaxis protein methyltransferase [Magnetospira sp. QH-2]